MSAPRARLGSTLVELLVSLPLALLTATVAALLLLRVARAARTQSSVLANVRELRHARLVLLADLQPIGGGDLRVVTDSQLEFRGRQGVLTLCEILEGGSLGVAVPSGSGDHWLSGVRAGDGVTLWQQLRVADAPRPIASTVLRPPAPLDVATCRGESAASPMRRWRLTVAESTPHLVVGAPVVVTRDVRYRHYRSGTHWWLGRQSRDGNNWEIIQPVAGPLRPSGLGMRLRARDAAGALTMVDSGAPDSVRARVRALEFALGMTRRTHESGGAEGDSALLLVPLRGSRVPQ